MPDPLVSVFIVSYNHENYIRQAIEGCLMQQTSFPYEIIIHDDASTDRSAQIIQEYADKYPELIIPILQKENQYSRGVKITLKVMLPLARGKYIAFCEGDDFWTDPKKLKKQIEFLENNCEYSGSAHQSLVLDGKEQRLFRKNVKSDIFLSDLLAGRIFHTASFVFRKKLVENFSPIPKGVLSGDRLIFIMVAAYGPVHYFNDVMCVYRKHESGMSNIVSYDRMKGDLVSADYLNNNIEHFPKFRYLSFIHNTCFQYPQEKLPLAIIFKHYLLSVFYSFSYFPKNLRAIASTTKGLFRIIGKRLKS